MKKINLQAGHAGMTSGAPGEREGNIRIRNRLSEILISKGFQLFLTDANPPQADINQDFDLFLAIHQDANIYGTGGGVVSYIADYIDSSPESNAESKRIKEAIEGQYFIHSGIVNHPERNNKNMTEYYMWSRLSAKTSCVIIECGVAQDAHDKVILADTDRVANALARGICLAFNVPFDAPVVPPTPPVVVTPPVVSDCENKLKIALDKLEKIKNIINS
jgi:N-acetylmuramoyl-L-alanine amidase